MILPIVIALIAAVILCCVAVWLIRSKRFRPDENKARQLQQLNDALAQAGFAYEPKNDYFYSLHDCWQRSAGYCRLYDEGSSLFNMIIDCEPIPFSYGGKRWLIELWKGQYGICTGGEIGIYSTANEDVASDAFTGTFYEPISDAEQMKMRFVLRRNGAVLLKRGGLHWWLTAFKLGVFSEKDMLTMDASITFPNREMRCAFTDALQQAGYRSGEFSVRANTVAIHFQKPHTLQPTMQKGLQEDIVQGVNKNNCALYHSVTAGYSDTLDKLEYLKTLAPELFDLMLHSLYGKGFFSAFEHIFKRPLPTPPACKPPCKPTCKPPCKECGGSTHTIRPCTPWCASCPWPPSCPPPCPGKKQPDCACPCTQKSEKNATAQQQNGTPKAETESEADQNKEA